MANELPHGYSKYCNERCRCAVCRAGNAEYSRINRARERRLIKLGKAVESMVRKGTYK